MSKSPSSRLPTQKEIARLAGVSQVTVNAVLNGSNHTRTRPETRELILSIAKQLNYKIQRHARAIRTGKSGAIALMTASTLVETAYLRQNLASLAIREAGFFPEIYNLSWTKGNFEELWAEMLQSRPEGILLVGGVALITPKVKECILKTELPIVSICGPFIEQIPLIIPDYRAGFCQLTRMLIGTGCRNLKLVMRDASSYQKAYRWQDERRLGFLDAVEGTDVSATVVDLAIQRPEGGEDRELLFTDPRLSDNYSYGYDYAREQLAQGAVADDAWMFFNDAWAQGALRALGEAKIAVPETLSVTGSDGELGGKYGYLPLTTLVQPIRQAVNAGVEQLISMIRDRMHRRNLVQRIPCEIRHGATTRPCGNQEG